MKCNVNVQVIDCAKQQCSLRSAMVDLGSAVKQTLGSADKMREKNGMTTMFF